MPGHSAQYELFRKQGYIELPGYITPAELAAMQKMFDDDRDQFGYFWHPFGLDQVINCDPLLTSPAVDDVIRHPQIFPLLRELMGGAVVFSEICLRYMPPRTGEPRRGWHRDRPHFQEHPIRLDYPQLMVYLTDVHEGTHCFTLSPESADAPILAEEEQLARSGIVDLHGPAGTAIIFNSSVLHTATSRPTDVDRKTIQIYYGHADRAFLSNDSFIPPTLWRDHADPAIRAFYGKLNDRSRLFAAACDRPVSRPAVAR